MGQPRRVLVACGTAIATSREVSKAVEEALKEQGLEVSTKACKASEVLALAPGMDLVLTTTQEKACFPTALAMPYKPRASPRPF